MNKIFLLALLLFEGLIYAQDAQVDNKWLVIVSGFNTKKGALNKSKEYEFDTEILNSSDFDNLNPGWFINCVSSDTKDDSKKISADLESQGVNNYIKFSGNYIGGEEYLINNHYVILNSKYVVLDKNIDSSSIDKIIGVDGIDITYIACASVKKEMIPDNYEYLKQKEFIVYNQAGKSIISKAKRFLLINVENPYWGFAQQWQINNTPSEEIAKELFEGENKLTLVAELDIKSEFLGRICHLKTSKGYSFADFKVGKNEPVENKAVSKIKTLESYAIHLNLLKESISKGAYDYEEEIPIKINTRLFELPNSKYVYINIYFGDYCDNMLYGHYFGEICGVYHVDEDTLEVLDFANHFNFAPIFSNNGENEIIGFIEEIYNGVGTYFKLAEWKLIKSYFIGTLECD
jgi:hypothetical protein